MGYGSIQKILLKQQGPQESILIENPFIETSRCGICLAAVHLAITPTNLIIAKTEEGENNDNPKKLLGISSVCSLNNIKIEIFKRTKRQTLKVTAFDNCKYYELKQGDNRMIFWSVWCQNVKELKEKKLWPFLQRSENSNPSYYSGSDPAVKSNLVTLTEKVDKIRWLDKYLYMGDKREIEDKGRPNPIPGLGPTDEIKLNYLKPEHFGCWDQSEHWVQSASSTPITNYNCELCTYTGEPTSNITYTSLMTTWK